MADPKMKRPKKLIACCDGTWMDADKGFVSGGLFSGPGHLQTPSNVTRIGRAILAEDRNHHPQIVYYQSGIGTGSTTIERLIGGGTGAGIGEHVREAYSFLANNYTHGDSIFLIGFSRGAFTARSIGGLISGLGLLEKAGLPWFYLIFKDWENAGVEGYKPEMTGDEGIPGFEISCPPTDIEGYLNSYRNELVKRGLTREVDIQAIGVWDTVGALGIPTPNWLQKFGLPDFLHEYKFLDTRIDNHVKHAFHAMALDEQRASYSPTIWERPDGCTTALKQVWFPGVHSNVGGSYDDTGIADITLAWMMSNLAPWIDFQPNYIQEQHHLNQKRNERKFHYQRGWSLGKLYDSCKFPTSLGGRAPRKPDRYNRINYFTSTEEPDHPLKDTNEFVHASVRTRLLMGGKGYDDHGAYAPQALTDWDMDNGFTYSDASGITPKKKDVKWVYRGSDPRAQGKIMHEESLGVYERELLGLDPIAYAEVLGS